MCSSDLEGDHRDLHSFPTRRSTDLLTLWEHIRKACGCPDLEVQHGPARAGDIRHSMARTEEARRILGFEPSVSMEAGLQATVAWYRSAPPVAR